MELDFNTFQYGFLLGLTVGSGLFVFGMLVGKFMDSSVFRRSSGKLDETEVVYDDEFFERATLTPEEGGHEFPTDAELAHYNRHSNEVLNG